MGTQTPADNTVNDLRYEIKFEICVKDKNNLFIKQNIAFLSSTKIFLFLEKYFFTIVKNLIISAFFFFVEADILKSIDMPRKKPQMLHWENVIKNDHVINCAMFFCKWFKYGQTCNVI